MHFLRTTGIPAPHDVIAFLFSGPRLFPRLDQGSVIMAPLVICGLAVLSSLYAALFAARVKPSEAMQEKE
jgi:ABC-type lipoprotein release transport system permease subunit